MIAPHLASSPHGLPILAPLAQYSTLGIKGERAANLLELGIHLHSETFISHAWNQAILDEQWCGRDARCGKVMLRRSPQSTWALLLQARPRPTSPDLARPRPISSDLVRSRPISPDLPFQEIHERKFYLAQQRDRRATFAEDTEGLSTAAVVSPRP